MQFFERVVNSLRRGGLRHTIRAGGRNLVTIVSRLVDAWFDGRRDVETGAYVEVSAMRDVTSDNLSRAIRYEPTRARPLVRLFRDIGLPVAGTFVDVGCGKGRVLMLAAEAGMSRVVGVDFSPSLCATARDNLDRFRERSPREFDYDVVEADAVDFRFENDHTVVYFYNPFDAHVLTRVISNLMASIETSPRPVTLIYHNPLWQHVIDDTSAFEMVHAATYGGCEFAVFETIQPG